MVMEYIPVVSSAEQLGKAIDYAADHPECRWYVARKAVQFGRDDVVPTEWLEGLIAAFKGDRSEQADKGNALPDGSFPIPSTEYLRRAIQAFGRAKNKPLAKRHIIKRAKALGAVSMLPEQWGVTAAVEPALTASGEPQDEALTPSEITVSVQQTLSSYAAGDAEADETKAVFEDAITAAAGSDHDMRETEFNVCDVIDAFLNTERIDRDEADDFKEAVIAAVRRVRTPEGAEFFDQPVGTVIVPNIYLPIGRKAFSQLKSGDWFESHGTKYHATSDAKPSSEGEGHFELSAIKESSEAGGMPSDVKNITVSSPGGAGTQLYRPAPKGAKATLDDDKAKAKIDPAGPWYDTADGKGYTQNPEIAKRNDDGSLVTPPAERYKAQVAAKAKSDTDMFFAMSEDQKRAWVRDATRTQIVDMRNALAGRDLNEKQHFGSVGILDNEALKRPDFAKKTTTVVPSGSKASSEILRDLPATGDMTDEQIVARKTELFSHKPMTDADHIEVATLASEQERRKMRAPTLTVSDDFIKRGEQARKKEAKDRFAVVQKRSDPSSMSVEELQSWDRELADQQFAQPPNIERALRLQKDRDKIKQHIDSKNTPAGSAGSHDAQTGDTAVSDSGAVGKVDAKPGMTESELRSWDDSLVRQSNEASTPEAKSEIGDQRAKIDARMQALTGRTRDSQSVAPSAFVKGKQTQPFSWPANAAPRTTEIDLTAKGSDPERFIPKLTMDDGSFPSKGMRVTDASGRTGVIGETYQKAALVKWDDGTTKTTVYKKLNARGDVDQPDSSATPAGIAPDGLGVPGDENVIDTPPTTPPKRSGPSSVPSRESTLRVTMKDMSDADLQKAIDSAAAAGNREGADGGKREQQWRAMEPKAAVQNRMDALRDKAVAQAEPGVVPDDGKTIRVQNEAQKILLEKELQGQISDGFWENSSPDWQDWSGAKVVVDPDHVGINWIARKNNYQLNSSRLLDIVGDRMVESVKEVDPSYDDKKMRRDLVELKKIFKTKRASIDASDVKGGDAPTPAPVAPTPAPSSPRLRDPKTAEELQRERDSFGDARTGYSVKELLELRNVDLPEIETEEADLAGYVKQNPNAYHGNPTPTVTVKVPGGTEMSISTDLARNELGYPGRASAVGTVSAYVSDPSKVTAQTLASLSVSDLKSLYAQLYAKYQANPSTPGIRIALSRVQSAITQKGGAV